MLKAAIVVTALTLCVVLYAATQTVDKPKTIAKASHVGPNLVVVTCLNGADPTGLKVAANSLLVSCGK